MTVENLYKGGMAVRRLWVWTGLAAAMAALRWVPGLAALWRDGVSLPALRTLNRWTGALPFPLAEPLALVLLGTALAALRRRPRRPLRLALLLIAVYALLWLPNGFAVPPPDPPVPDALPLEILCEELIDALNEEAAVLPTPAEVLTLAPEVAGLPEARVKAARYPEWMRARHIAGLFLPWTGEALADAGAHPALLPYTAAHELMHLAGIADEGAANIAAWKRCVAAGGGFALSARLWALRYGAGMLAEQDAFAPERLQRRMSPETLALWQATGPIAPEDGKGGYGKVVGWLVEQGMEP